MCHLDAAGRADVRSTSGVPNPYLGGVPGGGSFQFIKTTPYILSDSLSNRSALIGAAPTP
jgi:hypothetical protein